LRADYEVGRLNAGWSARDVAHGFAASYEREAQRVADDYRQYLGRTAPAAEIDGWVNHFLHGYSNEDLVANFVGSAEYFARHYNNSADWLWSAYHDVLPRDPDDSGYRGWLTGLEDS
jgi:hypothetical protein